MYRSHHQKRTHAAPADVAGTAAAAAACPGLLQCCTKAKHDFVSKIFLASGISTTQTAVPACIQPVHCDEPKMDLNNAQAEAKLVYGQVISEVLRKTGGPPLTQYDGLVAVHCGWQM
jgi:hypothetical protein